MPHWSCIRAVPRSCFLFRKAVLLFPGATLNSRVPLAPCSVLFSAHLRFQCLGPVIILSLPALTGGIINLITFVQYEVG